MYFSNVHIASIYLIYKILILLGLLTKILINNILLKKIRKLAEKNQPFLSVFNPRCCTILVNNAKIYQT